MDSSKIKVLKEILDSSMKLYTDGKSQYDKVMAAYTKIKSQYESYKKLISNFSNINLSPEQIVSSLGAIIPPGSTIEDILEREKEKIYKELDKINRERTFLEKEIQKLKKYLGGVLSDINNIKTQLGILVGSSSLKNKADKDLKSKNKISKDHNKKYSKIKKLYSKGKGKIVPLIKPAMLYAISLALNSQLKQLSKDIQNLSILVDEVNTQIESIQTKQDVAKAKVSKDSAIKALNKSLKQVQGIKNTIKTLQSVLSISRIVLTLILLIPIKTFPKTVRSINNLSSIIDSLSVLLGISVGSLGIMESEIEYHKSRLMPISDIIDKAITDNLEVGDTLNMLDSLSGSPYYNKLGVLDGLEYKGFSFAVYEEDNSKYVVAGNKRRYAVALDKNGKITLTSQFSFTLDPGVLIDELKLQIDIQNLEA